MNILTQVSGKIKRMGTHNGIFHADDVVAYSVLDHLFPDALLTRTRDLSILGDCDLVFDVGGQYNPRIHRYDHHQKEGAGTRMNGVPFASAGLIWNDFGLAFIENVLATECPEYHSKLINDAKNSMNTWMQSIHVLSEIQQAVDASFIQSIDATDCGMLYHHSTLKGTNQEVPSMTLSYAVRLFNPNTGIEKDAEESDSIFWNFIQATRLTQKILKRAVVNEAGLIFSRDKIKQSDNGNLILVLDTYYDWTKTVVSEMPHVSFVVFRTNTGQWNCQGVPVSLSDRFSLRVKLPEVWGGLESTELAKVSGVEDSVFCHRGLFICGAKSKEGAIALAEKALRKN